MNPHLAHSTQVQDKMCHLLYWIFTGNAESSKTLFSSANFDSLSPIHAMTTLRSYVYTPAFIF
jgi:hypothetical protein